MKVYKNKVKKLVYCPCRQMFLRWTPEEEVRQKLIEFLISDMKIPSESISTEYPLSKINPNSKQRADIVVWARGNRENERPLLVLELKAHHIEITDQTLEQVKSYNDILKAKYIGVSNGVTVELYEVEEDGIKPLENNLYTYSELIRGKVEYTEFRKMRRLTYDLVTYDRYLTYLYEKGYIGGGTPVEMYPLISELQNFILCGDILLRNRFEVSIIQDLSNGYFSYGNASGNGYTGYYRSFILKDEKGNHDICRIGIFGTDNLMDDPVYGNRKGNTYINVAFDNSETSSNILQLNMDRFFIYNEQQDCYEVEHNGKRNGFKNIEILNYVEKNEPSLIRDGKVYLGILPANKTIDINEGSDFVERLINYAYIREKLRRKKSKKD